MEIPDSKYKELRRLLETGLVYIEDGAVKIAAERIRSALKLLPEKKDKPKPPAKKSPPKTPKPIKPPAKS